MRSRPESIPIVAFTCAVGAVSVWGLYGCGGSESEGVGNTLSTVAGTGESGAVDGPASVARFHNPVNATVDSAGTIFVADYDNDRVRKIAEDGTVSTLIQQANFSRPFGLAVGPGNTLYVETDANDAGDRNATTGTVWQVNRSGGLATATVIARNLGRPRGLALLPGGDLALSDLAHHTISRLNVGTGAVTLIAGSSNNPGYKDGIGASARFNRPYGVTVLSDGALLVADQTNNRIRRVTLAGKVTTYAGAGTAGNANGPLLSATFNGPQDVDSAPDGTVYVADTLGHVIRAIGQGPSGLVVTTFAGTGVRGFADGPRLSAQFWGLEGIAIGHSGEIVVADGTGGDDDDPAYNRIRIIKD